LLSEKVYPIIAIKKFKRWIIRKKIVKTQTRYRAHSCVGFLPILKAPIAN
jgi:hypothetical protein